MNGSTESYYALKYWAAQPQHEQRGSKTTIMRLFSEFWAGQPSALEFEAATAGLVVFPEMLWLVAYRPWEHGK